MSEGSAGKGRESSEEAHSLPSGQGGLPGGGGAGSRPQRVGSLGSAVGARPQGMSVLEVEHKDTGVRKGGKRHGEARTAGFAALEGRWEQAQSWRGSSSFSEALDAELWSELCLPVT